MQATANAPLAALIGPRAARRVTLRDLREAVSENDLRNRWGLTESAARRAWAIREVTEAIAQTRLERGAAFRSSRDIFRRYSAMANLKHEQFRALLLDGKHRVICDVLISQGTLTSSPVHPREVFRRAMLEAAAAVVFVHNHPSGDPSPSRDDIDITRRLCEVGDLVGIQVLDHVVIGDGRYVSLADRGLMGGAL